MGWNASLGNRHGNSHFGRHDHRHQIFRKSATGVSNGPGRVDRFGRRLGEAPGIPTGLRHKGGRGGFSRSWRVPTTTSRNRLGGGGRGHQSGRWGGGGGGRKFGFGLPSPPHTRLRH